MKALTSLLLKSAAIFILLLCLTACQNNVVFDSFKSIPDEAWHKDSIIRFTVNSKDSISKNNIYINLRNNKDYPYSNLFLIVGIEFPNHYQIVDTLEYEMTSPEGHFLGTGMSDIKESKLEYKTHVSFPQAGDYLFSVQHAMRKTKDIDGLEYLDGITDVGVQIEKAQ